MAEPWERDYPAAAASPPPSSAPWERDYGSKPGMTTNTEAVLSRMQSEQNQSTSPVERFMKGAWSTIQGLAKAGNPVNPDEMLAAAKELSNGNYLEALHHAVRTGVGAQMEDAIRAHVEQGSKAVEAFKAGRSSEAAAHALAAALPFVGPQAAQLADQATGEPAMPPGQQVAPPSPPDIAGAAGAVAPIAALPVATRVGGAVTPSGLARTAEIVRHPVRNAVAAGLDVAARALKQAQDTPPPLPEAAPPPLPKQASGSQPPPVQVDSLPVRIVAEPIQSEPAPPAAPAEPYVPPKTSTPQPASPEYQEGYRRMQERRRGVPRGTEPTPAEIGKMPPDEASQHIDALIEKLRGKMEDKGIPVPSKEDLGKLAVPGQLARFNDDAPVIDSAKRKAYSTAGIANPTMITNPRGAQLAQELSDALDEAAKEGLPSPERYAGGDAAFAGKVSKGRAMRESAAKKAMEKAKARTNK